MTDTEKYSSPDMNAWNRQIMQEFRANEGKVGGPFEEGYEAPKAQRSQKKEFPNGIGGKT